MKNELTKHITWFDNVKIYIFFEAYNIVLYDYFLTKHFRENIV